jgi:Co/Zn/Cd efflux system component
MIMQKQSKSNHHLPSVERNKPEAPIITLVKLAGIIMIIEIIGYIIYL